MYYAGFKVIQFLKQSLVRIMYVFKEEIMTLEIHCTNERFFNLEKRLKILRKISPFRVTEDNRSLKYNKKKN